MRADFGDPEQLLGNQPCTITKRKTQPKPIQSLGDAAVERLMRFYRVLDGWDRDPAQRPIAVQQISDADLAQWFSKTDKEGMRSAILALHAQGQRRETATAGLRSYPIKLL